MMQSHKELTSVMSHDLGNPLGVIDGMLELVDRDLYTFDKLKGRIRTAVNSCIEIITLVREMRALEENKLSIQLRLQPLKAMIDESAQILSQKLTGKNITLEIDVDRNIKALVEHTSFVNSVLNNLITNAIKFSDADSKVIISANQVENKIYLSIRDFGIGIPDTLINDIFTINKPTHRPGTQGESGTGFGMPLVKKFVTIYGGKIEINSKEKLDTEEDHGTEIKLILRSDAP